MLEAVLVVELVQAYADIAAHVGDLLVVVDVDVVLVLNDTSFPGFALCIS